MGGIFCLRVEQTLRCTQAATPEYLRYDFLKPQPHPQCQFTIDTLYMLQMDQMGRGLGCYFFPEFVRTTYGQFRGICQSNASMRKQTLLLPPTSMKRVFTRTGATELKGKNISGNFCFNVFTQRWKNPNLLENHREFSL